MTRIPRQGQQAPSWSLLLLLAKGQHSSQKLPVGGFKKHTAALHGRYQELSPRASALPSSEGHRKSAHRPQGPGDRFRATKRAIAIGNSPLSPRREGWGRHVSMETMEMHVAVSSHSGTSFLDDWTRLRPQGYPAQPPEASPGRPDTVIEKGGGALHLHRAAPSPHSPPNRTSRSQCGAGGEGRGRRDLACVQREVTLASCRAVAPGEVEEVGTGQSYRLGTFRFGSFWGPGLVRA